MTLEDFAAMYEAQRREGLRVMHPTLVIDGPDALPAYRVRVTIRAKYTLIDFGDSGVFMIENATGDIFGIKGYGKVHRGHRYGNLATLEPADWDYRGYRPQRKAVRA